MAGLIKSLTDREFQKFKEATDGTPAVQTFSVNQLIPEEFDAINLSYTGDNLTQVEYLTGGTGGTAVATLALGYSGSTLTSVGKT